MASVDELKARMQGGGLRLNQYRLILPQLPGGSSIDPEEVSILCKATSLPGSTMTAIEVPFFGRKAKFSGEVEFQDWQCTILTDTNLNTRDAFEMWMSLMGHYADSLGEVATTQYQVDITVQALKRNGGVAKEYVIKNAFPTSVGSMALAYDSPDIGSFDVTFAFDYIVPKRGSGAVIK